jgi:predicted membrane channel-forming protein YqfA (hemolysin III family)
MVASQKLNLPLIVRSTTFGAYCVGILVMGVIKSGSVPVMSFRNSDKVLHAVVFGGLAILTYRLSSLLWPTVVRSKHACLAAFWSVILGTLLEVLQSFTTYRTADFLDLLADTLGAILFVVVAVFFRLERPNKLFLS